MWHRLVLLAFACVSIGPGIAQEFPAKAVRVVVGFPPGGGADMTARVVAQKLNEIWSRPVIVDNRPGAGGNLAAELVAKAAPDGYTIMVMPGPAAPSLYPKLPFDMRKDFAPITLAGRGPNVLVAHPSVPASTVKELIGLARARPGKLNYASSGVGITPHLAGELFRKMANIDIVHVPYKGAGPAVTDLVGGHVDLMIVSIPSVLGHIQAGRLRPLGVTALQRSAMLPQVPTLDEAGIRGYESHQWWGLLAPAGTPSELVMKVNAAAVKGLNASDAKKRYADEGAEVVANSPAEFADFFQKELTKWDGVFAVAKTAR
ncbi:MAG TPA: tripartite tricarboxylate transporter substrate binding protein [Burkholderiales bacterium]|nr:tripartite tricarboxylate transporter substrate binding protein [Burkholderiales bacterium]